MNFACDILVRNMYTELFIFFLIAGLEQNRYVMLYMYSKTVNFCSSVEE